MSNEATEVVLHTEEMIARYNAIKDLVERNVLREGIDYGVISEGKKPTLYKAGAEKLAALFGLSINIVLEDKIEDWEKPFFYYRYRAEARRNGEFIVSAEGSINSFEKKYRWRFIKDKEYDEKLHGKGVRIKRGGRYGTYYVWQVKNKDIFDHVNSMQKIGQKRSYVGVVLFATGASELFTQDLEDMDTSIPEIEENSAKEKPSEKAAENTPNTEVQEKPEAKPGGDDKITPRQRHTIFKLLAKAGFDPNKNKEAAAETKRLLEFIVGHEFSKTDDLTAGEAEEIIAALSASEEAVQELVGDFVAKEAESVAVTDGLTKKQLKKIMVLLKAFDVDDREKRIKFLAGLVGRKINSTNDLTKAEAIALIDVLEKMEKEIDGK